jgi:hypothetical protein
MSNQDQRVFKDTLDNLRAAGFSPEQPPPGWNPDAPTEVPTPPHIPRNLAEWDTRPLLDLIGQVQEWINYMTETTVPVAEAVVSQCDLNVKEAEAAAMIQIVEEMNISQISSNAKYRDSRVRLHPMVVAAHAQLEKVKTLASAQKRRLDSLEHRRWTITTVLSSRNRRETGDRASPVSDMSGVIRHAQAAVQAQQPPEQVGPVPWIPLPVPQEVVHPLTGPPDPLVVRPPEVRNG